MKRLVTMTVLAVLIAAAAGAQDDFRREGKGAKRKAKDALEGKAPPALTVEKWINTKGMKLADLSGKVVILDFWGTW